MVMFTVIAVLLLPCVVFSEGNAVQVMTPKKGIAAARFGPQNIAAAHASWYYNWRSSPNAGTVPSGVQAPEYVPMISRSGDVTDANINALKAGKANGTYKYLLGFNEPDIGSQANMSVSQVIGLWPRLMETGLVLGSPAPSWTNQWLSDFMAQAAANNLRVDFICLHYYRSPAATGVVDELKKFLTDAFTKYQKPIWVTEFGAPDCNKLGWCGTAPALTQPVVDAYTKQVIAMLEDLPCVQRYAWFVDASQTGFELSAIFKSDGTLSQTGTVFRDAAGTATLQRSQGAYSGGDGTVPLFIAEPGRIVCRLPVRQVSYRISFYSINGRCLFEHASSGCGKVTIPLQQVGLAHGTYVGRMESSGLTEQARFVIP
jgi:hypothetical protein